VNGPVVEKNEYFFIQSLNDAGNWSVVRLWKVKLIITNVSFHEAANASHGIINIIN
jgi:hypothetical protein